MYQELLVKDIHYTVRFCITFIILRNDDTYSSTGSFVFLLLANWVPLDEYYYSKQEGDPAYWEEKGEFRFKVGDVMYVCPQSRMKYD